MDVYSWVYEGGGRKVVKFKIENFITNRFYLVLALFMGY
jgi:hypothetical protein